MTLKEARDWATSLRKLKNYLGDMHTAEEGMIVLDDRVTELEILRDDRIAELETQRDDLLAACKMALKRKPFPVGAMRTKQMLEDAVAKAEI